MDESQACKVAPATAVQAMDMLMNGDLLSEIGMTRAHARTIKDRGTIPWHWHPTIAAVAERHGLPITRDVLDQFGPRPQLAMR